LPAKKPKEVACRFCGETCSTQRDTLSGWTHHHPSVCPYRNDRMPSLNGVHVGDVWRNRHTKEEVTVGEIRLGGRGTYTDREPVVVWEDRYIGVGGEPLWGLAEHWEPITRPKQWPVPWHYDKRFGKGGRSANEAWRCPGIRGGRRERRKYFHTYLYKDGEFSSAGWNWWQFDPVAEKKRRDTESAIAYATELLKNEEPLIVKVAESLLASLAEAA
jgi:hypothetical protein